MLRSSDESGHSAAVLTGKPYLVRVMGRGVFKPKHRIPGIDVAGRVEAVGRNVTHFRPW